MAGLVPAIHASSQIGIRTWMPGIADKFTQSAQGGLLWPGMTNEKAAGTKLRLILRLQDFPEIG